MLQCKVNCAKSVNWNAELYEKLLSDINTTKMSEAETNVEGCTFCKIGQNKRPETELLYDDTDYVVFRLVLLFRYLM